MQRLVRRGYRVVLLGCVKVPKRNALSHTHRTQVSLVLRLMVSHGEAYELQSRIPHKISKGVSQMSNQTHGEVSPNVRKSASERVREVDV